MAQTKVTSKEIQDLPTTFYNAGTLVAKDKSVIYRGWGFANGANAPIDQTITFPVTFATPPTVIATTLGYKSGSDPTSVTDIAGVATEIVRGGQMTTTTNCHIYITGPSGGNVGTGVRVIYNLMIIGELA